MLAGSLRWLFSPEAMWARSLDQRGDDRRALDGLTRDKLRAHDYQGAVAALDRCVTVTRGACPCVAERAQVRLHIPDADRATLDAAVSDARDALAKCGPTAAARATLAVALAAVGDGAAAEKEARDALKENDRSGPLHYALAVALDRQGRQVDALKEASLAVDLLGGRDAELLLGALLIRGGDLDAAKRVLDPLTADKSDAAVLYDRALIADRTNDYNAARQGYLAALHADHAYAIARYNLVLLTLRYGVLEEAKHHAKKFAEAFPDDARNAELQRKIAAASAPRQ
jgi:tetratricopeptide (TPR) repeat protein